MASRDISPQQWFDSQYERLKNDSKNGWVGEADWPFHEYWLEKALSAPYTPKRGMALEVGCGAGNWCQLIAGKGYQMTGVDFSSYAVAWAREQAAAADLDIRYFEGDATDLGALPDGSYQFILDGFCYHCLPEASDRSAYLAAVHRLLAPEGVFYLRAFCSDDPETGHWAERMDSGSRIVYEDGRPSKYIGSPAAIERAVREQGFEILFSEVSDFTDGMLQLHARRG